MDFYIVLGLPRTASPTEIKRAYRRLARRYHPDINPGDREADVRFQQILEAYETLMDPDRRRQYDAGEARRPGPQPSSSFGFAGFDFSATPHPERGTTFGELFQEVLSNRTGFDSGAQRGADLHVQASVSFEEAWQGLEWETIVTRQVSCPECAGSGHRQVAESRCPACEGAGTVRSVRRHMVFTKPCPQCGGTGRLVRKPCASCHGEGTAMRTERLTIPIPAGVADGSVVRVGGKGHAGVRGAAPGDLYVNVQVRPHRFFRREGDDVHVALPVALHEAALGARIAIPTPDGSARVRMPPGTQSGQRFRLEGRGMPSLREGRRGDLIVEARLMLPRVLNERSKELLREFARVNEESVRDELFRSE